MTLESSEHLDNLEQFVTNAFVNDAKGTVLTGISLDERLGAEIKSHRNNILDIFEWNHLLRPNIRKRLQKEYDNFILENYDNDNIEELAKVFTSVANRTQSPKLTKSFMDTLTWYENKDNFSDLVNSVWNFRKSFGGRSFRRMIKDRSVFSKMTKTLELCYDKKIENYLPQIFKKTSGFHNKKKVLKFLEIYHEMPHIEETVEYLYSINGNDTSKVLNKLLDKNVIKLVKLYQDDEVVNNIIKFLSHGDIKNTKYADSKRRLTKVLSLPEVVDVMKRLDKKRDLSSVFSSLMVLSLQGDKGNRGKEVVIHSLPVLETYYDKEAGDLFIRSFHGYVKNLSELHPFYLSSKAEDLTMPEVVGVVEQYQRSGHMPNLARVLTDTIEHGRKEDLIKITNFLRDSYDDLNISNYIDVLQSYSNSGLRGDIDGVVKLCKNNSNFHDLRMEDLKEYFMLVYHNIDDKEVKVSLPFKTINSLMEANSVFNNIVSEYSPEDYNYVTQQFFKILNKKITYGDTLEKKRQIVREWSDNLKNLIQDNIGDLLLMQPNESQKYLLGGRAA